MKTIIALLSGFVLTAASWAQAPVAAPPAAGSKAPVKVATIHVQNALLATKEGQKAAQELQGRFSPRQQELVKKQDDITAIQNQMRAGNATMSEAAKTKLAGDFDKGNKELQRAKDDFQAEVQQEEGKIMNELGTKLMDVLIKYTTQNAIAMVVDVSSQQSPVLWADPSIDITNEVVKLYDQAHPSAAAPAAATPPAAPPTIPPAKKK